MSGVTETPGPRPDGRDTAGSEYAERLRTRGDARWKRLLDVQRPYRWNLRRLELGRVLDIGCGVGRNLHGLAPGSVGVDHNEVAVAMARDAGLSAYTTEEFDGSDLDRPGAFDAILLAHVLEHVSAEVADEILDRYLPCVRDGGRVVLITPQEVGYRSDPTHVRFVDLETMRSHVVRLGLTVERAYSFPFPRPVGKVFTYNEFVLVASKPASA
ncbi:class I SAM-dependent methyltransferase [Nocardioides pocheonensis]|uniref:Class I SAM-dependent methyltransferase n=1 Tax=Nocardioides pocheonensis TaxID=661485 RepID=A0A3N0GMY4_9ACTN|nr:class I SAM-dependent methyltransferase [Nocardioides pocheonensis]